MRLFIGLVACTVFFASCASTPPANSAADSHAVIPRGGRPQPVTPGTPVETRSLVKFEDGSLDEYTVSEYNDKGTLLQKQQRFSASGMMVEEIEYTYNEDNGLLTTKMIKDAESNRLKSRVSYEYEGANLIKEFFVGRNGKVVSSNFYAYDTGGNVVSRIINNAAGVKLTETRYNYQNGLAVSSETQDNQGRKISSAENKYNASGNLTAQTIFNASGAVSRRINAEWRDGMEIKNEQFSSGGQVLVRITNEYGSSGELLKRTIENIEGRSTQILEYEYAFQQQAARARSR